MRKMTIVLLLLWTVSLIFTITFSVLLVGDFFKQNEINIKSITSGVSSISESIVDTFDYSNDTIISGNYDEINVETNDKLLIKPSENENIYLSEYHTTHKISEKDNVLSIKNANVDESESQLEAKTILYLPVNKINKLTVIATQNVNIEGVNFDQVSANIVNGNLNLFNAKIGKLSGTILDGHLNNSATIKDITLKVNENE